MPGDQGALKVRAYRVVEAENPGKGILTGTQLREQVLSYLVLDALELVAACAEFSEGLDCWGGCGAGG